LLVVALPRAPHGPCPLIAVHARWRQTLGVGAPPARTSGAAWYMISPAGRAEWTQPTSTTRRWRRATRSRRSVGSICGSYSASACSSSRSAASRLASRQDTFIPDRRPATAAAAAARLRRHMTRRWQTQAQCRTRDHRRRAHDAAGVRAPRPAPHLLARAREGPPSHRVLYRVSGAKGTKGHILGRFPPS